MGAGQDGLNACRATVADVGGLRDLVEPRVTGERFVPENPAAIAQAARRILTDPARAAGMANTAQERALAGFTWTAVAQAVVVFYQDVQTPSASTE